jgi:hypothetical protein
MVDAQSKHYGLIVLRICILDEKDMCMTSNNLKSHKLQLTPPIHTQYGPYRPQLWPVKLTLSIQGHAHKNLKLQQ